MESMLPRQASLTFWAESATNPSQIATKMPAFFDCPHCDKRGFKSQRALTQHIRNSICSAARERDNVATTPARGGFVAAQAQEDIGDEGFFPPSEDDDLLQDIAPPTLQRNDIFQPIEGHDLDHLTLQMGNLLDAMAGEEDKEESDDDLDNRVNEVQARYKEEGGADEAEFSEEEEEGVAEEEDDGNEAQEDDPNEAQEAEDEDASAGGPDTYIRDQFREYCDTAKEENLPFTKEEITAIRLMKTLHDKKASLNTYDDIMLWHLRECGELFDFQTLGDSTKFIGRNTMLKKLIKRYNYENKMPFKKTIRLPISKTEVSITLHSAQAIIQRLLTDPRIEPEHYLFWEEGNPLARPPEKVDVIKDLNTGLAHAETYAKLIDPDGREALLPIVLYFDGTAVSHFHNMEVNQVSIALGTFTRVARTQDFMWGPLGYMEKISEPGGRGRKIIAEANHMETYDIPDSDDSSNESVSHMEGVGNKPDQDTHAMMECILEEFCDLQETGFLWDHHDPGTGKDTLNIHYKVFVPFLKVDGKEGDWAAGKHGSRSNTKQICRQCHIPLAEADDHLHKIKRKTVSEIRKLVEQADLNGLKALSQTYLKNAFHNLRFSLGNDWGVHGSCPAEMLHAFLLGTFKYIRNVFFEILGKDSELSKMINALAMEFGKFFVRQSDRTQPATFFSRGIQKGKLMAKDYRGVMLLMLVICRSTKGRQLLKRKKVFREHGTLDDWILLTELMLEWESYLNEPEMAVREVKRLKNKHRYIMLIIRKVSQRKEGMGLKLDKFHKILHIWEDIMQYGVPLEYDTSSNESFHKPTKGASLMTQKSAEKFTYQTALRLTEFFLVALAILEIDHGKVLWKYYDRKPQPPPAPIPESAPWTGDTRIIVRREDTGEIRFQLVSQSKYKFETRWSTDVLHFLSRLQDDLEPHLQGKPLRILTCHRRKGQIFRGHPNYRGKGAWKDWAWVNWGGEWGTLPSQIWCFVDLRGLDLPGGRSALKNEGIVIQDGVYAVVETAEKEQVDPNRPEPRSELLEPVLKTVKERHVIEGTFHATRQFYLADTEAIVDPACVVPDLGGPYNRYFVVKPRNQWAEEFRKWVLDPHKEDDFNVQLPLIPMKKKRKLLSKSKKTTEAEKEDSDKEGESDEDSQKSKESMYSKATATKPARRKRKSG